MSAVMSSHTQPKAKTLAQVLEEFAPAASREIPIADVTLDSRSVAAGSLFIAVPGLKSHGLQFAAQAVAQGAAAVAYEPAADQAVADRVGNVPFIAVTNLRQSLGAIANRFFDRPSEAMQVVGVTGTNGKTTSAYLLPAALEKLGRSAGYTGTLGFGHIRSLKEFGHTTPDCISVHRQLASMRDAGDSAVGMEVSSHALDQGRVDGVRIHTALFTNLTRDHLDYHGTFEAYGAAKERLFYREEVKHSVINANDAFGRELIARQMKRASRAPLTVYATTAAYRTLGDHQLFASKIELASAGVRMEVDGSFGVGSLHSRLIGAFNAENILGVLSVLLCMDIPMSDAVHALEACTAPPGRMETLSAPNKPLVVIDYAHTPDALSKALQTARAHAKKRLICVFGCGGDRDAGKRPLMGEIAEQQADLVILTDDNPRMEDADAIVADILQGFNVPGDAVVERDRAKAIAHAISSSTADDLILIAGKGHEDYQIIGRNVKHFSDREVAGKYLGLLT
jgi:UDP-N-acetylmuramoyl-L-alanyl-D-glutamate--2,6-diaminopimelate ligase